MTTQKKHICEKVQRLSERVLASSADSYADVVHDATSGGKAPVRSTLSAKNLARYQRHLENCESCRVSHAVKLVMRMAVPEVENELQDRRIINAAIARARNAKPKNSRGINESNDKGASVPSRKYWAAIGMAAAFIVAAASFTLGWWMNADAHENEPMSGAVSVTMPGIFASHPSGGVTRGNGHSWALHPGAAIDVNGAKGNPKRDNRHFRNLATGVDTLLDAGSQIKVLESDEALLRVQLSSGRMLVEVNPRIPHPLVIVETPRGQVTVKGTIFSVDVSTEVEVAVLRGEVQVTNGNQTVAVPAGRTISIGNASPRALFQNEYSNLTKTFFTLEDKRRVPAQPVMADSTPDLVKSDKRDDPVDVGELKKSEVNNNERLNHLMGKARNLKNLHDLKGALAVYEKVIGLAPQSSFAASARIAAGNIRLRLGDAKVALSHFENYLSGAYSVLRQEALLGKIKSLRKLQNKQGELSAINAFIDTYPGAIHVDILRQRQNELQ